MKKNVRADQNHGVNSDLEGGEKKDLPWRGYFSLGDRKSYIWMA